MKTRDLLGLDVIGATMKMTMAKPKPVMTTSAAQPAVEQQPAKPAMTTAAAKPSGESKPTMTTAALVKPSEKAKTAGLAKAAAAKAAAKAKVTADAQKTAAKLVAAASKISRKFPKQAAKLSRAASTIKQHVSAKILGDPLSSIVGELLGEMTAQALDVNAYFAAFSNYFATANAVSICGDVMASVQPLVDQLNGAGQTHLATVGASIVARCSDIINNFNPDADPPDSSLGSTLQSIQATAGDWIAQAQSALAVPLPPAEPPVDPAAAAGGGGSDGGGSGAPDGGGGDPGAGEGGDEGGGGIDEGGVPSGDVPEGGVPGEGGGATESFEASADVTDTEEGASDGVDTTDTDDVTDDVPPADPFADIVGEMLGQPKRKRRVVGSAQVTHTPVAPPASTESSTFLDYFHKPLWTGSHVQIWQAGVGAGVAVVLSTVLIAVLRRKK